MMHCVCRCAKLVVVVENNGPYYHNSGFLVCLSEVNQVFNLTLVEYNNFEAWEGKTVLDTHFAHISHKIVSVGTCWQQS